MKVFFPFSVLIISITSVAGDTDMNIPQSELHYVPSHTEALDVMPSDFGPVLEPASQTETQPQPVVRGPVLLGRSLEQLLREGGHPGSSFEKTKQEFAAYLTKFEAVASRKTIVLQVHSSPDNSVCLADRILLHNYQHWFGL